MFTKQLAAPRRHFAFAGTIAICLVALIFAFSGQAFAQNVGTGPNFSNPRALVQETSSGDVIVADFGNGTIFRVNGATGDRTILSDPANAAQGPVLGAPAGIAILNGDIFVTDTTLQAVVKIDPVTGVRTIVNNTAFITPFGLAADAANNLLVVSDTGDSGGGNIVGPVILDPATGNATTIPVDAAVSFNDPRTVSVETSGAILIGDFATDSVVRVDRVTGTRTIVSSNAVGTGTGFGNIIGMTLSADGLTLFVSDFGREQVTAVDLANGNRTAFSGGAVGTGTDFAAPGGITRFGTSFMVSDFGLQALVLVDGATANRSKFSGGLVTGLVGPRDLVVLNKKKIFVSDFSSERILSVKVRNGARTVVSDNTTNGTGPLFNNPVAIAILPGGDLAVSEFTSEAIYRVNTTTGDRVLLTGSGVGTGDPIAARAIVLDKADKSRILGTSFNLDAVIAVDIATGDRTVISSPTVGAGPNLANPLGIAVARDGTIYVVDIALDALVKIDPVTGDRTIVSNATTGAGPLLGTPFGVASFDIKKRVRHRHHNRRRDRDDDGDDDKRHGKRRHHHWHIVRSTRILVVDASLKALVEIDPATGDRTILSDANTGIGPNLGNPFSVRGLVIRRRSGKPASVVVSDFATNSILKINLKTGDRTIVTGAGVGSDN